MKHLLIILSLFLFSFTVISCSDEKEESTENSGTTTNTVDDTTKFVGVGESVTIVRSTDNGSSFDNVTSPTSNYLWGVGFGNNTFVGVGASGKIVRSTDNGSSFSAVTPVDSTVLRGVGFATPPVLPVGFCYSDPNNSQWYLAKTADEPGWSSGDSCYTPSGSVTPYGGQSCIGGSGLTSCISACQTAGINCNSQ